MGKSHTDQAQQAAPGPGEYLPWEDLSDCPPAPAFRKTVRMLFLSPRRFFALMADTGGLHEPLTFLWIALAVLLCLIFPVTLIQFRLQAPSPEAVTPAQYAAFMVPARAAGFLLVLLPITLCVAAGAALLVALIYHLGTTVTGARGAERTLSAWAYMLGGCLILFSAGMVIALGGGLACLIVSLKSPRYRPQLAAVTDGCILIAACVSGVLSAVHLLVGLYSFHRQKTDQDAGGAIRSMLAGIGGMVIAFGAAWWLIAIVPYATPPGGRKAAPAKTGAHQPRLPVVPTQPERK